MKTRNEPAVGAGVLVDATWLDAHLHDPAVRVVEVDVSRRAHDEWHIEGAVLWDVYRDLKDAGYRLIGTAATEQLLARSGIGPQVTVVFHGYAPALGGWLLRLYGHEDVRILDCSRETWRDEGHPVSSQPFEPGGRAGHVPTAVHQPIDGLYDERGAFRDAAALRAVFSATDLDGTSELITYCTIGGRACTAWFVLTYLLGRDRVRVYDGSWAEWGRMAETPVESP